MRTTLELDDELVTIAKQLAKQRGSTLGQVITDLAMQSLAAKTPPKVRNGVILFTPKAGFPKPSLELINQLRDEA